MAVYKVPQDVEAEDKLLGPFSFRQFIYLVIAVLAGGLAYFLSTIFIPLVIIPIPLAIIFLILALPLKKDQPMEVYAAALLAFYLKPRLKIWESDGILSMVEFTNDSLTDQETSPDITFNEARQRISFLSNLVDSNGELVRNSLTTNPALQADINAEATQVEDIHDEDALINQKFDIMINQHNQTRREQIVDNLNEKGYSSSVAAIPPTYQSASAANPSAQPEKTLYSNQTSQLSNPASQITTQQTINIPNYSISPQNFQLPIESESYLANSLFTQTTINQAHPSPATKSNSASDSYAFQPSPDIINLANNNDLSIQTLATEAKKLADRHKKLLGEEDEVVIYLK